MSDFEPIEFEFNPNALDLTHDPNALDLTHEPSDCEPYDTELLPSFNHDN